MTSARFAGHEPSAGRDTHGLPWQGRELTGSAFSDDAGHADPRLRQALRAADEPQMMTLLHDARLLVPVVAQPVQVDSDSAGMRVETRTEMASVVLTAPDGRRAFPVFTGADSLASWDAAARPVPVSAADAARAAIDQECHVMLLDLGSEHAAVLRLSQMWALAQGRPWQEAHADPVVAEAVQAAAGRIEHIRGVNITGPPAPAPEGQAPSSVPAGVLAVVLHLDPGLARERIEDVTRQFGTMLGADPDVRIRIDGLALTVQGMPQRPSAQA